MWMGVLLFGTVVYLIFASGEIQPWAAHMAVGEPDLESEPNNDAQALIESNSHQLMEESEKQPLLGSRS